MGRGLLEPPPGSLEMPQLLSPPRGAARSTHTAGGAGGVRRACASATLEPGAPGSPGSPPFCEEGRAGRRTRAHRAAGCQQLLCSAGPRRLHALLPLPPPRLAPRCAAATARPIDERWPRRAAFKYPAPRREKRLLRPWGRES